MAETKTPKTLNVRFQQKIDTAANWANSTLPLLPGEIAIESDTGKFKFGGSENKVYKDLPYAGIDQAQLDATNDNFYEVLPGSTAEGVLKSLNDIKNPKKGDIAVVKEAISDSGIGTANSMTAYMFDGTNWCALDGNYDASNVYFDSNLVMTANIGVQTLGGASSKNLNTEGKSLKQVLSMILAKEEKPTITANPGVVTKIGNNSTPADKAITVEGGSTIIPKWDASLSAGSYSYGPATGITPTSWEVTGYLGSSAVSGHTGSAASGTFGSLVLGAGQSYKINAKASYNAAPLAYTNLGEEYKAGNALFDETTNATSVQIGAGSKNDDSQTISAWQQGYYIGTLESDVAITSDILRNTGTGAGVLKNRTVKNGNYAAQTDLKFSPTGTMAKFVLAYPASVDTKSDGSHNDAKGLASFFNNSSFEEYFGNFSRSIVKVAGADNDLSSTHAKDYAVWTWTPASAFSGTINFLIDLK